MVPEQTIVNTLMTITLLNSLYKHVTATVVEQTILARYKQHIVFL